MDDNILYIKEKVSSIDGNTHKNNIRQQLRDSIKVVACKEKISTGSVIKISVNKELKDKIKEILENKKKGEHKLEIWENASSMFIKFFDNKARARLIDQLNKGNQEEIMVARQIQANLDNKDIKKPVKFTINNVKDAVEAEEVVEYLNKLNIDGTRFSDARNGKKGANGKAISFKSNSKGVSLILCNMNGCLSIGGKKKLWPKINVKPWQCKDCGGTGSDHKCKGPACNNCGANKHNAKECTAKKYCNNCNKIGHRIRDLRCPKIMKEIVKEVERIDLPMELMETQEGRAILCDNLQLK